MCRRMALILFWAKLYAVGLTNVNNNLDLHMLYVNELCMMTVMAGSGCEQCSAEMRDLKRCGRCFVAKYCSRECQKTHWKSAHKSTCPGNSIVDAAGDYN